jgi:hypothetical protein
MDGKDPQYVPPLPPTPTPQRSGWNIRFTRSQVMVLALITTVCGVGMAGVWGAVAFAGGFLCAWMLKEKKDVELFKKLPT